MGTTLIQLSGVFASGRIYKCLFTGSVSSLLTLPLDMLSTWVTTRLFFSTTLKGILLMQLCSTRLFFSCLLSSVVFCSCRENLLADCLQGCFVVTCTLCAFISLVWLREQIVHGGAPQWLEQHHPPPPNAAGHANEVHCLTDCQLASHYFINKKVKTPYPTISHTSKSS